MIGTLVTVACLVAALWGVPFSEVTSAFRRASFAWFPAYFALLVSFYWIKAVRWRILLMPLKEFRSRELVPPLMIGFMGNNLLPAHLGEFMRIFVLSRQSGLAKTPVFSTVVLERVLDIVAILTYLMLSLLLIPDVPQEVRIFGYTVAVASAALIVAVAVYLVWTEWFVRVTEAILARIPFLPSGIKRGVAGMLEAGAEGLASLKSGRLLAGILVASYVKWFVNALMIHVSLLSFGVERPLLAALLVMGVTAFGVTVPSTPGFFGVVQACFVISLQPFGVDQATAFAASIYYHLGQYIPVTASGLFFLSRIGLKLSDLSHRAEEADEEVVDEVTHAVDLPGGDE